MTTGWRGSRGALLDPLLVFVAGCVLFALHGTQGPLDRDLGVFLYGGEQVSHGVPSYVGIFNSVGPLSDAVPAIAIVAGRLLGISPVLASRLLYLGLSAASCAAVCVLARRTFGSRPAGFLAAAVLASAAAFLQLASDGPREKTLMVLFLLLALIWLQERHWLLAGAATAIATLTWQPVFVVAVAAAISAVALQRTGRLRALGAFLVGGLLPTATTVVVLAAAGALGPAIDGFVVINVRYTRQPSLLADPAGVLHLVWDGYSWTIVPFLVGLLALPLLALRRSRADGGGRRRRLVLVAAELAAVGWLLVAVNGAPDLFDVLPFGALGVAGLVLLVVARIPAPGRVLVTAACVLAAVTASATVAVQTRSDALVAQRAAVDDVLGELPAGATVLSVNAPDAMVLADRTNPTPWQVFNGSEDRFLNTDLPGGLPAYAAWIDRVRPDLIVVGAHNPEAWLRGVLRRDYRNVGVTGTWHWYASTTLGPTRLQLLRSGVAGWREHRDDTSWRVTGLA